MSTAAHSALKSPEAYGCPRSCRSWAHAACSATSEYHIRCSFRLHITPVETKMHAHVQQGRTGLTQFCDRPQRYQKHALLSRALHVFLQQQLCERTQRAAVCSPHKAVELSLNAPTPDLFIPGLSIPSTIQKLKILLNSFAEVCRRALIG